MKKIKSRYLIVYIIPILVNFFAMVYLLLSENVVLYLLLGIVLSAIVPIYLNLVNYFIFKEEPLINRRQMLNVLLSLICPLIYTSIPVINGFGWDWETGIFVLTLEVISGGLIFVFTVFNVVYWRYKNKVMTEK